MKKTLIAILMVILLSGCVTIHKMSTSILKDDKLIGTSTSELTFYGMSSHVFKRRPDGSFELVIQEDTLLPATLKSLIGIAGELGGGY